MHLDTLPDREHIVYTHDSVQRRQQTFGYTEEELKILLGADGPDRRRAARLDGHGHPDRGAEQATPAAVRLLHPAVRAGDQPAAGRDPGGAGHQRLLHDRPGGEPARPRSGQLPPGRAAVPGHRQRRAGEDPVHRRGRRPAGLPGGPGQRAVPWPPGGEGLRDRLVEICRGVSEAIEDGVRILVLSDRDSTVGPRADPVAAADRGGAPAPDPRADPHPGRADRRVRRLPRGAPRRRADRLRRGRGQPVPGLRVGRGPDRHRRADRDRRRPRRSATTSRRSARAS